MVLPAPPCSPIRPPCYSANVWRTFGRKFLKPLTDPTCGTAAMPLFLPVIQEITGRDPFAPDCVAHHPVPCFGDWRDPSGPLSERPRRSAGFSRAPFNEDRYPGLLGTIPVPTRICRTRPTRPKSRKHSEQRRE